MNRIERILFSFTMPLIFINYKFFNSLALYVFSLILIIYFLAIRIVRKRAQKKRLQELKKIQLETIKDELDSQDMIKIDENY